MAKGSEHETTFSDVFRAASRNLGPRLSHGHNIINRRALRWRDYRRVQRASEFGESVRTNFVCLGD